MPVHALLVSSLALTLAAAGAAGRAPAPSGPTLAVEDTMHTEVPPTLVQAPRVTLDEILDRVARGEARRDSMIHDESFLNTVRVFANTATARREPEMVAETVSRVYKRRPDKVRVLQLRHWEKKPDKKDQSGDGVDFKPDMSEEIVNFAFRPAARRSYRYRIVGRDLAGNHLIYRIEFEPRSALDPSLPSGLVWVDTNDFVIVRQEIRFGRSPMPILLKDVRRMVIERARVGTTWVLSRVVLRIEFAFPLPTIGRTFDVAVGFEDYAINSGLDDALFAKAPR